MWFYYGDKQTKKQTNTMAFKSKYILESKGICRRSVCCLIPVPMFSFVADLYFIFFGIAMHQSDKFPFQTQAATN